MRAGALNRRVTFLVQAPGIDDGMRVKPAGWSPLAKRWAELTPLSGAERIAAGEDAAVDTVKFRVRRDSVTAAIDPALHRLVYDGRTYDITAKAEFGKQGFDFTVTGRADEPGE